MITATIKYTGTFADRPNTKVIQLDESSLAAETQLHTGKIKKWTVGELYDIFKKNQSYITSAHDPLDQVLPVHFEVWFRAKHIDGKSYDGRIISVEYKKQENMASSL